MKEFRTEIMIKPSISRMNWKASILTLGSCFAGAIGNRLTTHKFNALTNPFGTIYNPESIHEALKYSILNKTPHEQTYLHRQDVYLNYNFHSKFSALKKQELAENLTNTIGSTHDFLKDADWLLITYGTAWVYHRKETGEIVANCHKMPTNRFTKSLLTTGEIILSFRNFYDLVKHINPNLKIILTVSPVRHLKDTLELNNVGKSALLLACHFIVNQFRSVEYFPAYEIMMDDLRDYRFYQSDKLHPTFEAEDYIWEKFLDRYVDEETKDFINRWGAVLSAMNHKPFLPQSASHQQFLKDTLKKLAELKSFVNVDEEERHLQNQVF